MQHIGLLLVISLAACGQQSAQQQTITTRQTDTTSVYRFRTPSRDGIGKVYQGREIAQVMGHLGAAWLERPEREQEERTDLLLNALDLKPTDVVADIGAGTGFFTFRMASEIPKGKVIAVDIQPEMIAYLNQGKAKSKATNVEPVLGTESDPKLKPSSIDLAILIDAYHEFSYPREMISHVATALKPSGRLVLVEYRAEDPAVPIKELHKLSIAQATKEMKAAGLRLLKNDDRLPQQHIMFFGR
ncbi:MULTISPECIES: class I SAM-dependent methyltransferase [unclassified Spirosoma]|uniref:class I SAM-dependent methyltransferase n=1 Tax=unclassified Spirosoma TaxID=2621999 RepID=UPI00095977A4|nr:MULTISPECIES: class I SAM-dependent methyltransferase [unclassified Spirosoma]MBN8822148.1 class I SAM-dependent methyltransferase [Spirosoma sp.]OJW80544.1 MAG: methyltransferase type 11 [Spirosoma sp. 48-14]